MFAAAVASLAWNFGVLWQMNDVKRSLEISAMMDASGVRFGTSGARGRVVDMTDEVCFAYTAAFIQTLPPGTKRVARAIDLRPSSPAIAAACAAAISWKACCI